MHWAIVVILIIGLALVVNKWVVKPKKLIRRLEREFREKGFKVKVYPFNPLGAPQVTEMFNAIKTKGDPFYADRNDVKYEVAIYNILSKVGINIKAAELIKEATGPEKVMIEQKVISIF